MAWMVKGKNVELTGTYEVVYGVGVINGRDEDGKPVYAGETDIWWDEQKTVLDPVGEILWVGEDTNIYPNNQVEWRPEAEEMAD